MCAPAGTRAGGGGRERGGQLGGGRALCPPHRRPPPLLQRPVAPRSPPTPRPQETQPAGEPESTTQVRPYHFALNGTLISPLCAAMRVELPETLIIIEIHLNTEKKMVYLSVVLVIQKYHATSNHQRAINCRSPKMKVT